MKWLLVFDPLGKVAHVFLGFLVVSSRSIALFFQCCQYVYNSTILSCINAFRAVSLDILSYTVLCQNICQPGNCWCNQWDNTRIILMKWELFHCSTSFSVSPLLLFFSPVESCSGIYRPLYYIKVVVFRLWCVLCVQHVCCMPK